jgi:acyl carrier protein
VQHLESVKDILAEVLSLGSRKALLQANTPLLGSIPEFVPWPLSASLPCSKSISGSSWSADTFATLGSLCAFVEHKVSG